MEKNDGFDGIDISDPMYKNYFIKKREVWDEKLCKKLANATATDGMGTKYPFKGYVGHRVREVVVKYNGGTIIDGQWYQGVITPRPLLPKDYEFINVTSWGLRLIKQIV